MSKATEHVVTIRPDGGLEFIYNDDLALVLTEGQADVRRASHVEPASGGGWTADLTPSGGPVLGPYPLRREALAAELAWLRDRMALGAA